VLNLLVNARQSLEQRLDLARQHPGVVQEDWRPQVTVRTTVVDDIVRIEVSDNGTGISAADLSHIWDPFWTSRDEGEGNGLGLAVVHGIVSAHGGTIDVRSEERMGTTFSIALPLAPAPLEKARAEEPAGNAHTSTVGIRPLDVLIVDDEQSLRTLLQRVFSERGHAVVTAADGKQALRLAEQASFDVVVCDLRMPAMDGRDVIQQMRAYPTCANTRFILCTGDVDSLPSQFTSSTALVDAIVAKPYSVSRLLEIIEGRPPA
jgi:CheY-like chemotaxis protein